MANEQGANSTQLTRKDVVSVRNQMEIERIKRRARISAWSDYIEFIVSKTVGLGGLVIGGLEWLDPALLPIVIQRPALIAGGGLALLIGKSILSLLSKAEKLFGGEYD